MSSLSLSHLTIFLFFISFMHQAHFLVLVSCTTLELRALMDIKASLDPDSKYLSSWTLDGNPCDSSSSFEGIGCNEYGQVANISLQGKGLVGKLSPAISGLQHLAGLYLHYNSLYGEIPREIGNLTMLSDLYLNMNNLSGQIPEEIGNTQNLQVLQLSYNQLTGNIPTQLGSLRRLTVCALQSNRLEGAIPATLGDSEVLMRIDLSFNHLFGSIPTRLAELPLIEVLDVQNNSLSGSVPTGLKRLNEGFLYANNLDLCGEAFLSLRACNASDRLRTNRPEAFGPGSTGSAVNIPETANVQLPCSQTECTSVPKSHHPSVFVGVIVATIALSAIGTFLITQYRRHKQKLGMSLELSDNHPSTDQSYSFYRKTGSPLASLEYSNGWDPLADGRITNISQQEHFHSFRFNLEEVESATQYFSEANLLGRSNSSTTYKGILRDGSLVAIKCISKTSCKSEEAEFLKGLNILTSLRHENLVRLRGFCCSRGRGECFLIYDFASNGNLLRYLDQEGDGNILEWSARVSIVKGIAKGIAYLHGHKANKPALLHQNISAEKVLIDQRYSPLLSDSGLHKILTNDIMFSSLKASAAMGYLAPEYASTGRFTEKSDVYAFGVVVFQILSGKRNVNYLIHSSADTCKFHDFIDLNLRGRFFEYEAAKLAKIASLCTHESPVDRPSMEAVIQELSNCSSCP